MKYLKPFPRPEGRRTGNVCIVVFMLLSLCILSIIKLRYCSTPNAQSFSSQIGVAPAKSANSATTENIGDQDVPENTSEFPASTKPLCANTTKRSNICRAEGDIRMRAHSHTVFLHPSLTRQRWTNKPYARLHDPVAMKKVDEWTLRPFPVLAPKCTKRHAVPALVFSIGGFTGNLFHDFTDVLVPLFVSSYRFRGEVQFVLADVKSFWVDKFGPILKQLTNYDLIDAGRDGEEIRCFPRVILGLDFHKELGVDPSKTPGNYSMKQFRELLRKGFGLERVESTIGTKPRLMLINRNKTRVFLNKNEIKETATELGFQVLLEEPDNTTDLVKFSRLVNSVDAMIGVHGAGLTNMVFLPDNAVLVQVVPMGKLGWLATETFEDPAPDMGIKYLDYEIGMNESSLIDRYPADDPVLTDPQSIQDRGWYETSRVYLEDQDVRPDLGRLRERLTDALGLLHWANSTSLSLSLSLSSSSSSNFSDDGVDMIGH